jgi:thiosulfate dehydrogenase
MKTSALRAQTGGINGLLLFIGGMTGLVLLVVIGFNFLFNRSLKVPLPTSSPVPATAAAPTRAGNESAAALAAAQAVRAPADAPAGAASAANTSSVGPAIPAIPASSAAGGTKGSAGPVAGFRPPPEASLPDGEYGKVIRLGQQVFTNTGKYAARYVGNDLACANCHLDAGRHADSAPLWASFIHYPAYRKKTGQVDTLASRIQGCFQFSMNGKAPPQDDEVMTALQTYAFWLATGAPVGTAVAGSGYPKLDKPAQPPDFARGQKVYEENCALCHGADGQGQRAGNAQVFPPLWGPRSFNWGAGMHQLGNASGFIRANMPLGKGGTLSDQEAWDVAAFMNSHERPQDPRFTGSVVETRKKFHDSNDSLYGLTVNGHLLGSGR